MDVTPNGGNHPKIGDWNSYEHINQATGILVYFIDRIGNKFPNWSAEQKLKGLSAKQCDLTVRYTLCSKVLFTFTGGIAAYNMGDGSVHSYQNVDANTTGRDYSNDVVARAQWYKSSKGF